MTTNFKWQSQSRAEAKRLRDNLRKRIDRLESAKVKVRSQGWCEVQSHDGWDGKQYRHMHYCRERATQVHHMIGGHGKRAHGPSLLAEHKQHVCDRCHLFITGDIGGKKLKLIQFGDLPMWNDRYLRVA